MNRAERRRKQKAHSRTAVHHPDAVNSMLNRAIGLHQSGDLRQAMPLYNEVLTAQPNNHVALHMLALMAYQIGNHQLALDYVDQALSLDPENAAYHNTRSAALRSLGRNDDAIDSCREAVGADPEYAEAHFNLGNLLVERGQIVEATACFETAADLRPGYDAASFRLGQLRLEQDQLEPALEAFRRPLALEPDNPDALNNCGNILMQLGRTDEALQSYHKAIESAPKHPQAHFNLGYALHRRGRLTQAHEAYQRALEVDPDFVPAINNLAELLNEQGNYESALPLLEDAIRRFPEHLGLQFNLACALKNSGQREQAEQACRNIIRAKPDHESARHLLDTLNGYTPESIPAGYVRGLFDNCSERFEDHLVTNLSYDGPNQLLSTLLEATGDKIEFRRMLDLGCGSGLAGRVFRQYCGQIDGLDLSPRMIELAEKKNIYNSLETADLVEYLSRPGEEYDLLVAADVLTYLGNLQPLFEAIKNRACAKTWFVFTTESWDGDGYRLQPSGRIAHSQSYIEKTAAASGLEVARSRAIRLRREGNEWINGEAYVLRLSNGEAE